MHLQKIKTCSKEIRIKDITPILEKNEEIILDFEGIERLNLSYMH